MESQNKKFSTSILILSITCALLIGFIGGYSTANFLIFKNLYSFPSSTVFTHIPEKHESNASREIIFYNPGNEELWKDTYKEIPDGEGLITGRIFINDSPAEGLEFSLLLASGRKTQKSIVSKDGSYEIPIPKGKYYLNGLLIYNKREMIDDKFLINKIAMEEEMSLFLDKTNNQAIQDEYSKLERQIGGKKAAEKLLKNIIASSSFRDKFPFEVDVTSVKLPDFHYRDPLRIISPTGNSAVNLNNLKFIWEPVQNASYYKIHIVHIDKKGSSTSYYPVITYNYIRENQISYKELSMVVEKSGFKLECDKNKALEPRKVYGFKVIAYDQNNRIFTASSLETSQLSIFTVGNKP